MSSPSALVRISALLFSCAFATATAAFAADHRLTGPYTHNNATLFLVHPTTPAPPRPATARQQRPYLPLQQALALKKAVVHETGNVNELAIENLSPDTDVFIQSGDIVKGGQQDRVFATDLILPPKSGRAKIEAFCVEQGRWSRRGSENARQFSVSDKAIVSKEAKLAIRGSKNQGEVWKSVAALQEKLERSLGRPATLAAPASPTSLQLSLENRRVSESSAAFAQALKQAASRESAGATGYVFAVNGELRGADLYASPELFSALWPKLAESLAVEAISETPAANSAAARRPPPVTAGAALEFLLAAERAHPPAPAEKPNPRTSVVKKESPKALLVESHDNASRAWVHRGYTAK